MSNIEFRSEKEIINEAVRMYKKEQGQIRVFDIITKLGIYIVANEELKHSGRINYDKENKSFTIEINPDESRRRQRFTAGHELGHFILHRKELIEKGCLDRDNPNTKEAVQMEKDADIFAGKLLMPDNCVTSFVEQRYDINLNGAITDSAVIEDVADEFMVSRPASIVRLRELGYYVPYIAF